MKTYCDVDNSCIHRRGCKLWLGNYDEEYAKEVKNSFNASLVDVKRCIPDYQDKENTNQFEMLDRFRYSDGREFNNKGLY